MDNQEFYIKKVRHKEWRRLAKKLRRKKTRQRIAKEKDQQKENDEKNKLNNPEYQKWLKDKETLELCRLQTEKHQHQLEEENWMRRELLAQKKFNDDKKRREEIEANNEAQRLKIQQDFEELQKAAQNKRDEKRKQAEEIEYQHKLLLTKIQDYIKGNRDLPSELKKSADSNPGKELCQFFMKTASCRFHDKCERNHSRPGLSKILLIRNFFTHIQLAQSRNTEYGSDINLEFTDADLNNDYEIFYNDVIPEMRKFGKIINFKVCSNCLGHLRGNVYVEFEKNRDALKAYLKLQGRYYAGKQLNIEFCSLISWKTAICGESFYKKCPKGRSCNFLHIFKNPGNKYNNVYSKINNITEQQNIDTSNSSWDNIDGETSNEHRNWRWSESPERLSKNSNKNLNKLDYHNSLKNRVARHSKSPHLYSRSPRKYKREISRSRSRNRRSRSRHTDSTGRSSKNRERVSSSQKSTRKEHSSSSQESSNKKKKKKHKTKEKKK